MTFFPNQAFLLLSPAERQKFVYPKNWDLSEIRRLPSQRKAGRPAYVEADRNRLYGGAWLLEQIAERTGLRQDLEAVFAGNKEKAANVLSLAMFSILTDKTFSHMALMQEAIKFPAVGRLTPAVITRMLQSITEQNRMDLFRFRQNRCGQDSVCAIDSTTRSSYGRKLSDLANGHSKDHLPLPQTTEVVAYSLTERQPLYFQTFPGNLPDSRSLCTILQELRHAGFTDLIIVTDRGYESRMNLTYCILKKQRLLTAAKIGQKEIQKRIEELLRLPGELDDHMDYVPGAEVYACQYDVEMSATGKGGKKVAADRLRLTLCLDLERRAAERRELARIVHEQEEGLKMLQKAEMPLSNHDRRLYSFFTVERDAETKVVKAFERNGTKYAKVRSKCGFFAYWTLGLDYSAAETIRAYRLRDMQEKYFHGMKGRIHADRQLSWTDGAMHGRRFVEFVALILISRLEHAWAEKSELRRLVPTIEDMLTIMNQVHCIEHNHRDCIVTPFVGKQLQICAEFGFDVPPNCSPAYIRVNRSKGSS